MRKTTTILFAIFCIISVLPNVSFGVEDKEEPLEMMLFMDIPVTIASGKSEKLKDAPANVYVITGEEMRDRGYRTLIDLLKDLPGTIWNNREGFITNGSPIIRGIFDSRRLKLMFNGMTFDPKCGSGTSWHERFPVEGIERVEFIVGPYAPLYGRNTFIGVVNVITKTGGQIDGTSVSLLTGNYHQLGAAGIYGKKINDWDLYISAFSNSSKRGRDMSEEYDAYKIENREGSSAMGDWFTPTFKDGLPPDFYMPWNNKEVFLKTKHKSGLGVDVQFNQAVFTKTGTGLNQYYYVANDESVTTDNTVNTKVSYEYKRNENLDFTTALIYQNLTFYGKNIYAFPADAAKPSEAAEKWYGQESKSIMIEEKVNYNLFDNNSLYAGVSWETVDENPFKSGVYGADIDKLVWADSEKVTSKYTNISLQDRISLSESLQVVVGLMYENSNSYKDVIIPRFSAIYRVLQDDTLKLLYGGGYLTPDPVVRANQVLASRASSIRGVTDIKPESLVSYEAQYIHKFNRKTTGNVSVFMNVIKDIVVTVPTPASDPSFGLTYGNQGKKRTKGLELNMDSEVFESAKIFASYGFVEGKMDFISSGVTNTLDRLPVSAKSHYKVGVTVPLLDKKLKFYIHDLYVGRYNLWMSQTYDNWNNVGDYSVVDVNVLSTPVFNKTWNFSIGVGNVFNAEGYDAPLEDDPYFIFPYPIKKRNWTVNVSANF